jgi:hypothetical protein
MVFWEGNTGDTSDLYPDWSSPAHNDTEMNQYRQLGEAGYIAEKRRLSFLFLRNHFPLFVRLTLQRIVFTWTGFWNLRADYLSGEPFAFPNIAVCSVLTIFMSMGIRRAILASQFRVIPLLFVLAFYPLVYYVTHPGMDYRHPLDALITMLGASYITGTLAEKKAGVAKMPVFGPIHSDNAASIQMAEQKTGAVVFAHAVNKKNTPHGG